MKSRTSIYVREGGVWWYWAVQSMRGKLRPHVVVRCVLHVGNHLKFESALRKWHNLKRSSIKISVGGMPARDSTRAVDEGTHVYHLIGLIPGGNRRFNYLKKLYIHLICGFLDVTVRHEYPAWQVRGGCLPCLWRTV